VRALPERGQDVGLGVVRFGVLDQYVAGMGEGICGQGVDGRVSRGSSRTSPRTRPACLRATAATRSRSEVFAIARASSEPAQPVAPARHTLSTMVFAFFRSHQRFDAQGRRFRSELHGRRRGSPRDQHRLNGEDAGVRGPLRFWQLAGVNALAGISASTSIASDVSDSCQPR